MCAKRKKAASRKKKVRRKQIIWDKWIGCMYPVIRSQRFFIALVVAGGILAAFGLITVIAAPYQEKVLSSQDAVTSQIQQESSKIISKPSEMEVSVSEHHAEIIDVTAMNEAYEQLDDWSLILVNDVVPLPEDFSVSFQAYSDVQIDSRIYTNLDAMLNDASDAGVNLWVASGYRGIEDQGEILENAVANRMNEFGMTREEAEGNALLTIQKPGHSEHHTGLAVDFNDVSRDFKNTDAYSWLIENAEKYGFIQRYPEDKEDITGINYECWHFRYVGKENAAEMNRLHLCLEEYVLYLKNQM